MPRADALRTRADLNRIERERMQRLRRPGPPGVHEMNNRTASRNQALLAFLAQHQLVGQFKHPKRNEMEKCETDMESAISYPLISALFQKHLENNNLPLDLGFLAASKKFSKFRGDEGTRLHRATDILATFLNRLSQRKVTLQDATKTEIYKMIHGKCWQRTFAKARIEVYRRLRVHFKRFISSSAFLQVKSISI